MSTSVRNSRLTGGIDKETLRASHGAGRRFIMVGVVASLGSLGLGCNPGEIGGGPAASGSAGNTMTGSAGSGSIAGSGGGTVIDPTQPQSTDWYDGLKAADCSSASTALPASRIWRLSSAQWQNTVTQALDITAPSVAGFPQDQLDPRTGFSTDSTGDKISLSLATSYFDASDAAAALAAPKAIAAFSCLATAPIATACGQMFAAAYGKRLFRRTLTSAETMTYAKYLNSESALDPAQTAVASALKAMMLSPNFLYRTELGNSKAGTVDLTSDEIASLLSYTIADMPPDDMLQQAATAGQLSNATTRSVQAERLAAMPSAKNKLATFWREYLALGSAPTTAGLDLSAYNEATTFFSKIVLENGGTLKELLTAPYTYADITAAAIYGTTKPAADGKLMLDPTQRAGFLTSTAMLSQTAAPSQAATVIHRGLLVRERVLCQTPPPPPASVVPDPAQIQMAGDNATAKENYDFFAMTHASCNSCHTFFQPLGLAFENYDATGKYRTAYPSGKPILTTGKLTYAGDATGDYTNVADMAQKLGNSDMAGYCMAQQFAQFAFGRSVSLDQEACTIKSMGDFVTGKGGQVRELLASFAAAPTVYKRFHQ
jgi:hypothetical protein